MIDIKSDSIYYRSLCYALLMVIFMIFGYMFFIAGIDGKVKFKTYYQSDSDVNYKINYDNDEFPTYISDIRLVYNYNSVFNDKIEGYYKYNAAAYLYAYEDNIDNVIWYRKYDLADYNIVNIDNNDNVEIRDSLVIDYQKYKKDLNNFMDSEDINALGYINVKINVIECLDTDDNIDKNVKSRTININIPIADVFDIDVDNVSVRDTYYKFNRHSILNFILVVLSMICIVFSFVLLILIIKQFRIISDRQNNYVKKLKRILSKYDYCIVKVNKLYVNKKYNMIYVSSFDELLDVYNTRNKMINFKEVKRGMESIFVIIDSNDAWIYKLTSNNVEKGR